MVMPDFSKYNLEELYDSLNHIDRERFPDRVKIIEGLIKEKTKDPQVLEEKSESVEVVTPNMPVLDGKRRFIELVTPGGETIRQELASRWLRYGGAVVDGIILLIPMLIISLLVRDPEAKHPFVHFNMQLLLIFFLGQIIYVGINGYLLWKNGQTVGKRLIGTRVVDRHGLVPSFFSVYVVRYLAIGIVGLIPLLGIFFLFGDVVSIFGEDVRCIHDHMAGTWVILAGKEFRPSGGNKGKNKVSQ